MIVLFVLYDCRISDQNSCEITARNRKLQRECNVDRITIGIRSFRILEIYCLPPFGRKTFSYWRTLIAREHHKTTNIQQWLHLWLINLGHTDLHTYAKLCLKAKNRGNRFMGPAISLHTMYPIGRYWIGPGITNISYGLGKREDFQNTRWEGHLRPSWQSLELKCRNARRWKFTRTSSRHRIDPHRNLYAEERIKRGFEALRKYFFGVHELGSYPGHITSLAGWNNLRDHRFYFVISVRHKYVIINSLRMFNPVNGIATQMITTS